MSQNPNTSLRGRTLSLDAFRGLAILMMVLSGVVPYRLLPGWMYHGQLPPPRHIFSPELAGITWVDLVFPMFLFAMGAAIPLALNRKFDTQTSTWERHRHILQRGLKLMVFAVFLQHIRPYTLNAGPDYFTWIQAILGLIVLFLLYSVKFPFSLPIKVARGAGILGASVILVTYTYPDGSGFTLGRSDIIILVLANMAIFGSWVWWLTREKPAMRYGIMALLAGLILSSTNEGWVQVVWESSPVPTLFKFYYLKYLFIIIPGIFVGEWLRNWSPNPIYGSEKSGNLILLLTISGILVTVVNIVGLYTRSVEITVILSVIIIVGQWYTLSRFDSEIPHIISKIIRFAGFFLFLGLCLEPFEGGIKKDVSTFSYYFVTTGLSIYILLFFMVFVDIKGKTKWFPFLVENGQNPMFAYVGMMNLIFPVLALTNLDLLTNKYFLDPWMGLLRGVIYIVLLAWITAKLTRRGYIWKT
jgi:predicted acyltransferase